MTRVGWLVIVLACAGMLGPTLGLRDGDRGRPPLAPPPTPTADPGVQRVAALAERGAPLREQATALHRFLAGRGVGKATRDVVRAHTRPGIALYPGGEADRSAIGGPAVLPAGEPWPEAGGDPLTFVAALDLAALPHLDPLPREGTLALYWNGEHFESDMPDDGTAARAYLLPPGAEAEHPTPPAETYPASLTPLRGEVVAIPGDPHLVADEIEGRPDADALFEAMNDLMGTGAYPHHLLGAPIEIQSSVLKDDWVLLAQIEETDDFIIADGGVLHFLIRRADLRAQRFDRVTAVMESH